MASSSPKKSEVDKKDEPLLDLGEDGSQGGASRNSLQAGEVDIQEWERRLVDGKNINFRTYSTAPHLTVERFCRSKI